VFVGYRYYQAHHERPQFPFGYGLSYTSFRFGHPRLSGRPGRWRVSVQVQNTGRRAGSEVVQLYVGDPPAAQEPPRQLEGFRRVTLRPRQQTRVSFRLTPRQLSYWHGRWVAARGTYRLYMGDSSVSLPAGLTLTVPRTIFTGAHLGRAPRLGSDSPALAARCPKDALAPDVAAMLTVAGDGQAIAGALGSLP
jgi:beta-glucosidase